MVAAGVRRGDMRWLAVGGTCGRTVALGDGGWRRAHAVGPCAVPVVPVCAVPVLCSVDGV